MSTSTIDALFVAFQQVVIGRYSLERELGRGGMGVVYLAREVRLDRLVAIKLLPPDLADRPELRDRFLREARTAARLSHPYIVPIHAVDEIDGFVFIVMAYVDGGTLAQRIASRGPLPAGDVTRIMREVAWALAYAHAQGVIHRDIKPANILLEQGTGRAMVADFGIARLAEASGDTVAGMVLGTPEYMSPEQATAEELDGRSDLYSLGVVAYYALTGQLPFTGPSAQVVLAQHLTKAPAPAASVARGAPRALTQAIDRCLEKSAAARFDNGEAIADALERGLEKSVEIPVPIRVFLDRRRMAMLAMPAGFIAAGTSGIVASLMLHDAGWAVPLVGIGAVVLALGLPFSIIVYRLRRVLRLGYGLDDIVGGLRRSFERHREEFQYEFGMEPTRREKTFRLAGITGFVIGGASLAALAVIGAPAAGVLAPVGLTSLYLGTLATIFSNKWRRLRVGKDSLWSRFWSGRIAKQIARVAGFRLGDRAVPADRPTELAIAMSAEALFGTLPKALRESLGDVPAVLHELEAHARVARARIGEMDAAIAEAQRGKGSGRAASATLQDTLVADLALARERAEVRLGELVTSLETLRLDLLRLRSDGGSLDGITRDVAAAKAFGEQADRLLASGREVEEALRVPRETPR